MSLRKFATLEILDHHLAGSSLPARTAHRAVFDYEVKPGYLYVRSRAISSRVNDNYDSWPPEEIKQAYRTFVGKPVFVNHNNEDHRKARGVIIDAALHEDTNPDGTPDTWAEVLMQVDANTYPKLAAAVISGEVDRTSMGADISFSKCSVCGNEAETPAQYCKHIPGSKGQRITRNGKAVLCSEICYGISFFENSLLVEAPADPSAVVWGVDTSGLTGDSKFASIIREANARKATRTAKSNDVRPSSPSLDRMDHRRGNTELTSGSSNQPLASAESNSDLSDISISQFGLMVSDPLEAPATGNHVSRVHGVGAQDPVSGVVTEDDITSVANHLAGRDQTNKVLVPPAVRPNRGTHLVGQTESAVPAVLEHTASPQVAGIRTSRRVDLGQVPLHRGVQHTGDSSPALSKAANLLAQVEVGDSVIPALAKAAALLKVAAGSLTAGKWPLDMPVSGAGMVYSPSHMEIPEVAAAKTWGGWNDLSTTTVPIAGLKATEEAVASHHVDKVVGGEPFRAGYDPYVLINDQGNKYLIDGHTRAMMYSGLGRTSMPAHVLDLRTQKMAYGEQMAPTPVDTLRADSCPVCGESFTQTDGKCPVCSYDQPPQAFDDPDLTKAKENDLRGGDTEDQGLQCDNCGADFPLDSSDDDDDQDTSNTKKPDFLNNKKSALAPQPTPTKGSGPVKCSEPECHGHREKCLFGQRHQWQTWYQNGKLMRTPDTFHCHVCGGVCVGDEDPISQTSTLAPGPASNDDGIAVVLTMSDIDAETVAVYGEEPADNLHCTLGYFGDAEGSQTDRGALEDICHTLATRYLAFEATLGGITRFTGEDSDPLVANVDSPVVTEVYRDFRAALEAENILGLAVNHGMTPHCTLGYLDPDDDMPLQRFPTTQIRFTAIEIWWGGERKVYQLGMQSPLTEAASLLAFLSQTPLQQAASLLREAEAVEEGEQSNPTDPTPDKEITTPKAGDTCPKCNEGTLVEVDLSDTDDDDDDLDEDNAAVPDPDEDGADLGDDDDDLDGDLNLEDEDNPGSDSEPLDQKDIDTELDQDDEDDMDEDDPTDRSSDDSEADDGDGSESDDSVEDPDDLDDDEGDGDDSDDADDLDDDEDEDEDKKPDFLKNKGKK